MFMCIHGYEQRLHIKASVSRAVKSITLFAYEYVTRMQGFLCTKQWAGADDVDHAAGVTSHFFHQQ